MYTILFFKNVRLLAIVAFIMNFDSCTNSKIFDMITDEEFFKIFHTEREKAPEHEFVTLNTSTTIQFRRTLLPQQRFLSFTAFGVHYNLNLKLQDDVLLGKNTPIWHAKTNPRDSSNTEYILLKNILDNVNGIYQDSSGMATLLEYRLTKSGKAFYGGMIAADLAISPLPERLVNELSNSTKDGAIKNHVIYKVISENVTIDNDPIVEPAAKYKRDTPRAQSLNILYPEMLVVVDASLYKQLGEEPISAMNYLAPFWNGVDLRYKLFKSPEVKVNVAGIILAQDETALNFLYSNLDEKGRIFGKSALVDAGEYFSKNAKLFTPKDAVIIMTKRDICSLKYGTYCKSSTLGKAFTGHICSKKKNTAIFEDNGGYSGIITATHELGHLLGLTHDGDDEASNCSIEDGFIMASAKFRSINSSRWSTCSLRQLKRFASLTAANCLENKPAKLGPLVAQTLPGKVLSLEDQCSARGGKPCVYNATVCWKLYCTKSMTNFKCVGKGPAAEGSTCGEGLYCRNGECILETNEIQNKLP